MIRLKDLLLEVLGPVRDKYDSKYNYQVRNGVWHTQPKGSTSWISLKNNPTAMNKLDTAFPNDRNQSSEFPIKNKIEGDKFRKWVNDTYPEYAKEIDLDPAGAFNNSYIKKAWKKYGKEYLNTTTTKTSSDDNEDIFSIDPNLSGITFKENWVDLIDSAKRVDLCKAPQFVNQCASFVNAVDPTINYLGNAWIAYNTQTGKKLTYNVMDTLPQLQKNTYEMYYNMAKRGEIASKESGKRNSNFRKLMNDIIADKKPSKNILTPGSHVGIYWPRSSYHQKAFVDSSKIGREKYNRPYSPFNTHIGIVIAIKDDVPIILHEIEGTGIAEPYDKLGKGAKIVWVKSDPKPKSFMQKASDALNSLIKRITS